MPNRLKKTAEWEPRILGVAIKMGQGVATGRISMKDDIGNPEFSVWFVLSLSIWLNVTISELSTNMKSEGNNLIGNFRYITNFTLLV
jgi:hypothetical protein